MHDCDTSAGHPADDRRPSAPLPLLPQCDPSPVRSRSMRTARGRHSLIRRTPSERAREGQPLRPLPSRHSFPCPPSRRNASCGSMLRPVTWPNSRSPSPHGEHRGEPGTPRRIRGGVRRRERGGGSAETGALRTYPCTVRRSCQKVRGTKSYPCPPHHAAEGCLRRRHRGPSTRLALTRLCTSWKSSRSPARMRRVVSVVPGTTPRSHP